MSRSVTSLLELSGEEMGALAGALGHGVERAPGRPLEGRVVAVLPFGPRDLPPAAWAAAAYRLGAGVLRSEDFETLDPDAYELCGEAARWADVLVVSHSHAGFARAVAEQTGRAVLNAGEAGGESPAAGLSLLAAALRDSEPGRPLRAAVCGDLRESRSARALLGGLAALDATVLLVPAQGRDLPEHVLLRIARRMRREPLRFEAHAMSSLLDMVDTVLLAREEQPQLPLFREVGMPPGDAARRARREVEDLDVLFVAAPPGGADRLVREPFRRTRRGALPEGAQHETDPRAPEALLRLCAAGAEPVPEEPPLGRYRSGLGLRCRGERCAAARTPGRVTPDFAFVWRRPAVLECAYCGTRSEARFAASKLERRFHGVDSADAEKINERNLVLFASRAEALAAGFEAPRPRARRARPPAAAAPPVPPERPAAHDEESE